MFWQYWLLQLYCNTLFRSWVCRTSLSRSVNNELPHLVTKTPAQSSQISAMHELIFLLDVLQALCCSDSISQTCVTISDFSDEILLNILRFIPSHDLMLNVSQVCRKLRTLCLDKSLRAHVQLHKEYTVSLKKQTHF